MEQQDRECLKDWTKDDKLCLYQVIKTCGSQNIEQIHEYFPDKTKENIEAVLNYYKKRAMKHGGIDGNIVKERPRKSEPYIPLNSWAKLLTESIPFEDLHTEVATALRVIADFEDIPQTVCTEKVDFRKIYHTLANALEGKALCEDKLMASVINKCIVETALTGKAFMRCNAHKNLIKDIRLYEKNLSPFIKPTENNELSIIRQIAMNKNYNPLNISEAHLKFSLT